MRTLNRPLTLVAIGIWAVTAWAAPAEKEAPAGSTAGPYHVSKIWHIGGEGRWDYLSVDPHAKRLYVTRQTHTQIISQETGKVIGDLKDTPGAHGVALVPEINRGFVSNGQGKSITVFDLKTFDVIETVPAGDGADAIIYDPASKKVLSFNGRSKDVTVIPAVAKPDPAATSRIELDGKPEFAVSDGKGRVYVNLEDKSTIAVIDTKAMKVIERWPIEGGESPSGLALDNKHHLLFSGCENEVMAVIDAKTGKTVTTIPIGKGVDACAFDPKTGYAFASCGGDGTLTIARQASPGKFEVVQKLQTKRGARTMGLDLETHVVYLPTAELGEPAPGQRRPMPKPDTFMILVVSPQK